jgi:hypothetical protein
VGFTVVAALAASARAYAAGGSYLTDDATITPEGHCQLETWVREITPSSLEGDASPACTFDGVEWSGILVHRDDHDAGTLYGLSAKWVGGDLERDGRAIGVAASVTHAGGATTSLVYVPASVAVLPEQRLVLNVNLGARRLPTTPWRAVAGFGFDVALSRTWHLIGEDNDFAGAEKIAQIGARWSASESIDIDLVFGEGRRMDDRHWVTVGVNAGF